MCDVQVSQLLVIACWLSTRPTSGMRSPKNSCTKSCTGSPTCLNSWLRTITLLSAVLYEVANWPEDLQARGNTWTPAKLVVNCQWARHKSKSMFPECRRGTWSWATRQNVICGSSNHSLIGLYETPAFSMSLPKGRGQLCNRATSHAQSEPQTEMLRSELHNHQCLASILSPTSSNAPESRREENQLELPLDSWHPTLCLESLPKHKHWTPNSPSNH